MVAVSSIFLARGQLRQGAVQHNRLSTTGATHSGTSTVSASVSLYVATYTSVPLLDRKCSGMFKLVNLEECLTMKTIVNCKTLS